MFDYAVGYNLLCYCKKHCNKFKKSKLDPQLYKAECTANCYYPILINNGVKFTENETELDAMKIQFHMERCDKIVEISLDDELFKEIKRDV